MKEINKITGKRNPRLAHKIIQYLKDDDKFTFEEIRNRDERFTSLLSGFFDMLSKEISEESILSFLDILNISIESEELENIVTILLECEYFEQLIDYFISILKDTKYGIHTEVIMKLLVNYWLYKNGYSLLVFYEGTMSRILGMINEDEDMEVIKKLIGIEYSKNYYKNEAVTARSVVDIEEILLKKQEELNAFYGITKLCIYGAYANETENEFSDCNIYVGANRFLSVDEIMSLKDYLKVVLQTKVDLTLNKKVLMFPGIIEVF